MGLLVPLVEFRGHHDKLVSAASAWDAEIGLILFLA